eukprot:gnl/TRDRNA2_/TRDRNA2_140150_c0_seq3.p1 gnl/TRDRNA2_/TRDRNA2_140150_c0~~gnl/TRDRNA2_/TRDRNA2_140150_c0_seq3.p1  ORF type:complete len:313 (+),score=26.18 gnl/TRDRNA2_/TRDRNA2_140150_c0_seq3:68-1006(+)
MTTQAACGHWHSYLLSVRRLLLLVVFASAQDVSWKITACQRLAMGATPLPVFKWDKEGDRAFVTEIVQARDNSYAFVIQGLEAHMISNLPGFADLVLAQGSQPFQGLVNSRLGRFFRLPGSTWNTNMTVEEFRNRPDWYWYSRSFRSEEVKIAVRDAATLFLGEETPAVEPILMVSHSGASANKRADLVHSMLFQADGETTAFTWPRTLQKTTYPLPFSHPLPQQSMAAVCLGERPDSEATRAFDPSVAQAAVLHKGEAIFFPARWSHYFVNTGPNISVSYGASASREAILSAESSASALRQGDTELYRHEL